MQFDPPPPTPASIQAAQDAATCERAVMPAAMGHRFTPPTEEEWERLAAVEGLRGLCEKYTYARVARWVRNLAAMHGQEV